MALTPEEQQELQKLEAEEAAYAKSPVEEEAQESALNPEAAGLSPRDRVPLTDGDALAAIATGGGEGLTRGGLAEASGHVQASGSVAFGDTPMEAYGEAYAKHRNETQDEMDRLEAKHPYLYNLSNIAGSFIGAPGSITGAVAQGGIAAFNYARPAKRSDVLTLSEGMQEAALGMGIDAGFAAIPVVGGVASRKGKKFAKPLTDKLMAGTLGESLGIVNKYKEQLTSKLRHTGRKVEEWAEEMLSLKTPDGEALLSPKQTYSETLDKVSDIKDDTGRKIGSIVDDVSDNVKDIDGDDIYKNIYTEYLSDMLHADEADIKQAGMALDGYLKKILYKENVTTKMTQKGDILEKVQEVSQEPVNLSLSRIQKLKNDTASFLMSNKGVKKEFSNMNDANKAKIKDRLVGIYTGIIDGKVEQHLKKSGDDLAYGSWKSLKTTYGDVSFAKKALEDKIDKIDTPGVVSMIRNSLNYQGFVLGGLLYKAGLPGEASVAGGMALNQVIKSPGFPATMTVKLQQISDSLARNPKKNSNLATRLFAAAGMSSKILGDTIEHVHAEVSLGESPLSRSSVELYKRQDEVLNLLHSKNKLKEAHALRTLLDDNNPEGTANLIHSLAGTPELKSFFEGGIGWDGKAVTPEEQQDVTKQIKSNYGLKKQWELLNKFNQDQVIPTEEESIDPQKMFIYNKAKSKLNEPEY